MVWDANGCTGDVSVRSREPQLNAPPLDREQPERRLWRPGQRVGDDDERVQQEFLQQP